MASSNNSFSSVETWDTVAQGYADITMQFFNGYATQAINIAELEPHFSIVDVACGPGTLSLQAADKVTAIEAIDLSPNMIDIFNTFIAEKDVKHINIQVGDAQQLPFSENSFDRAFSMFGLMFFPDRQQGYQSIMKSLKPGGKLLVSSWQSVSQSSSMQAMFGAIRAMNPEMPAPQDEVESLENAAFFKKELETAGFEQVEILPIVEQLTVESIDEFMDVLVRGCAPIAMMKKKLPQDEWEKKQAAARGFLETHLPELPVSLAQKAWLGVGTKPA